MNDNRRRKIIPVVLTAANIMLLLLAYFAIVTTPVDKREPSPTLPPLPTPTPLEVLQLVIAVQNLPRGTIITPDVLAYRIWPVEMAPFSAVINLEDVIGTIARTDIYREQPILFTMVTDSRLNMSNVGSDAASVIAPGTVGKTLLLRANLLPLGLAPGDRVNIYHTLPGENGGTTILTVPDALVLAIGTAPDFGFPTPTLAGTLSHISSTVTPSLAPELIPVTVVVTPQDAATLIWAEENELSLSLVLRSPIDIARHGVTPVATDSVANTYGIR